MAKVTLHLDSESRADLALLKALTISGVRISRAQLKAIFKKGSILYKDQSLSPSHLFAKGRFEISYPDHLTEDNASAKPSVKGCFLDILYEDENLLILNKLSGVPSIPHSPSETETALGAALAHAPEAISLHRLDTGTSGAIAFAKTDSEFIRLRDLWSTNAVQKTYKVWVSSPKGVPFPKVPQTLKLKMGHDPKSSKKMKIVSEKDKIRGKPYPTETRLVSILDQTQHFYEIEILIQTGVMHQIRCTLAHLGWPVLGDSTYKGQSFSRLMLHAWKLKIPLASGRDLQIVAPSDSTFRLEA